MVNIQDIDLIKQFVDKYNSAQASIEAKDAGTAKKKYKELLNIYNAIHASKLEKENKELAYEQVMKIYQGVHSIRIAKPFISKSVLIAGVILLASIVIFIKPDIIGLVLEQSTINQAPYWSSAQTVFDVRSPQTRINLNDYFTDPDNDELVYLATSANGINVDVSGSWIIITPAGASGQKQITVIASDGEETAKQTITLNVASTLRGYIMA